MLMLSVVVIVHMCGREGAKRGPSKGTKNGAVDSEHGASKGGSLLLRTKSHHSNYEGTFLSFINATHTINIVYILAMLYD